MIAARRRTALIALALGSANAFPGAAGDDPRLAPGRDPGGTAVAILADGFDYTKPELAAVLARDGVECAKIPPGTSANRSICARK